MAQNNILPKAQSRLVDQAGQPTREFYHFFNALVNNVTAQIDDLAGVIDNLANVIVALGGDPETGAGIINVAAAVEGKADNTITITGTGSLGGGGDLTQDRFINLDGDVDTPPGVSFYGSPDGTNKGWAAFSANFATSMDADDNVTLDLADLADSGTGSALVKITRDSKGRISGTSAATTTDLTEGSNLYFTNARADARVAIGITALQAETDPFPQYTTEGEAAAAAPVQSVNGYTGAVTLTAADVGAATTAQGALADTALQDAPSDGTTYGRKDGAWEATGGGSASMPPGYIDGLQMQWVSGTALTVSSGAAYIEGSAAVLSAPSAIAKTSLSLTASTWYHVYLYDNAGTPDVEVVTTAPAAAFSGTARSKTGDTSRRYAGSVLADTSGRLWNFFHDGDFLRWNVTVGSAGAFRALSAGSAFANTTVSLSSFMPVTARIAFVRVINTAPLGQPTVKIGNGSELIYSVDATQSVYVPAITDSSQAVIYAYASTSAPSSGGCYIDVCGYKLVR